MSDNNFEHRCAIKFCFRLGHNATETFAKLQQAYGDSVLSRAQVFRWFKAFSEGRESIEDEPRSGRRSVSKTAENAIRVRDLVRSDHRLTPPYSPDLSPCDFFLFPKLKNHLKGHHFETLENIQMAVTDQLKAVPISEFHQCYEEWKKRLQRCVASEGSYFEGDNVEFSDLSTEAQQQIFELYNLKAGLSISYDNRGEQF
ncbi:protein GVQW3 [Trichonephila clavipes]|uniref:Protein GVQW3 n=1 Tax=Trichonephila clavipes TaxID=2585209 RepID=A0A8X6V978_TRICX|nr:protein GVQW3 [Trichonephila clavipes]